MLITELAPSMAQDPGTGLGSNRLLPPGGPGCVGASASPFAVEPTYVAFEPTGRRMDVWQPMATKLNLTPAPGPGSWRLRVLPGSPP